MSSTNNLQGIGSILGSECQFSKTPASLRRTLSADMSSKKWLTQHGFAPLKKIASSEELQMISERDIWNSIQTDVGKKDELEKLAPYVHPLTKRSRSLSQKSLEICTESLGSETGSDGFSSYSPSEASDGEQEQEEEQAVVIVVEKEEIETEPKFVSLNTKKFSPPSFPPPIPSLSLHMRSHRQDGRLVLEAVPLPVPCQNNFVAQRGGGRLLLTLVNSPSEQEKQHSTTQQAAQLEMKNEDVEEGEEFEEDDNYGDEEEEEDDEDEDEEEEEEMEKGNVLGMKVSDAKTSLPTGVINVHRSALMVNKLMGITNRDPTSTWSPKLPSKFDTMNNQLTPPQSLPISRIIPTGAAAAAAASFNTYEYCWRTKTQSSPPPHSPNKVFSAENINPQYPQKFLLLRGNKAEHFVPLSKGCKEPRRSLFWEPYCIATS